MCINWSGQAAASVYTSISKMNFSNWEPPGVSQRIWSVNLEVSISGEYQNLVGLSAWPSEELGSLMTGTALPCERLWYVWEQLRGLQRKLGGPESAGNEPRSTSNQSWAVGKNIIFFGYTAGAPENHSYYLIFNDFQNLCIEFVHASMSLGIYIATKSTHNMWGQTAGHSWKQCEVHLKMTIKWTQKFTWWPSSRMFRDSLAGWDQANWELQFGLRRGMPALSSMRRYDMVCSHIGASDIRCKSE